MQHRTRDLMMRQRTQLINALRAHLAELGIVAAQGDKGVTELLAIVSDDRDARLPVDARASVIVLAAQLEAVQTLIGSIERRIKTQHRANEASKRLETIPGIGVIGATAIAATVADPTVFRSGRDSRAPVQQRRIRAPTCRELARRSPPRRELLRRCLGTSPRPQPRPAPAQQYCYSLDLQRGGRRAHDRV